MPQIFSTSRIRFQELYQDALNFVKNSYGALGQYFTLASPMGQLLQVVLSYGRMILFYNEDSVTELHFIGKYSKWFNLYDYTTR